MEVKQVTSVLLGLVKNPSFLFTTLAGITEAFGISGLSTFTAKFVENAFTYLQAEQKYFLVSFKVIFKKFPDCVAFKHVYYQLLLILLLTYGVFELNNINILSKKELFMS